MKKILLALGTLAMSTGALACGDDTVVPPADAGNDGTTVEASTPADTGPATEAGTLPTPPTLGAEIDRMGRPAINTALNHVFDTNATTKGAAKDLYNEDSVPAHWSTYVPQFESNLAIYDALDTVCGNQAAYGALGNPAYATLATVLSADELWVNTANATCDLYLGVELGVLGVANTDCGGRTLTENVIDITYNAVAGTLTLAADAGAPGPVTNGITAPASPPSTTFPYMAAPH